MFKIYKRLKCQSAEQAIADNLKITRELDANLHDTLDLTERLSDLTNLRVRADVTIPFRERRRAHQH